MHLRPSRALPLFLLAASLTSQTYFAAPPAFASTEGESAVSFNHPFTAAKARYQYCHGNLRGTAQPGIKSVAFRRDGVAPTSAEYEPRTATLAILLAHANFATLTTTYASNYLTPAVTVFTPKNVNLPDHSSKPTTAPAPWSITLPFDVQWSYNGTNDLLLELQVDAGSSIKGYSLDSVDTRQAGLGTVTYLDPTQKCTTANGPYEFYAYAPLTNAANTVNLRVYGIGAPSSTPSALLVGLSDPNVIGAFCAPLRSSLELTVPLTSSSTGALGTSGAPLTYNFPTGMPFGLYLQFASLTAIPKAVHLSDAARVDIRLGNDGIAVKQVANRFDELAATGTLTSLFVPVVRFER